MKSLNEDIKTFNLKRVYLLYGEESYLRRFYRDKLKNMIIGNDEINYSYYEGKNIDINAVIDICETMPFFNDKRLVIIENSGLFSSAQDKLADYILELPEYIHIIFVEEKVNKTYKIFKNISKTGGAICLEPLNEAAIIKWIVGYLGKAEKKITKEAVEEFISRVDNDMDNMITEMQKLISFVGDREGIITKDIEAICTVHIENRIFEMIDAVSKKNKTGAMELYKDLITLRESPFGILALMNRQFNMLIQIKELDSMRLPYREIATRIHSRDFIVKKYAGIAAKLSADYLKRGIKLILSTDEDIKQGRISDTIGVELVIAELTSGK